MLQPMCFKGGVIVCLRPLKQTQRSAKFLDKACYEAAFISNTKLLENERPGLFACWLCPSPDMLTLD